MLLRKIMEFVDKNIAERAGRFIGFSMAIPFVPYMFVDGTPIERFPVLAGLSFVVSFTWGVFVLWRAVLHYIELRWGDED